MLRTQTTTVNSLLIHTLGGPILPWVTGEYGLTIPAFYQPFANFGGPFFYEL
jgi:hypothetical protein